MSQIKAGAVLYAVDYSRIADFYKNVTGMNICNTDNNHIRLESESFQLVVLQAPKNIAQLMEIHNPPIKRESTPIKLVFFVNNINEARELIKTLGGELDTSEKEWVFNKHKVCDGHDPEGNVFQLRTYIQYH